MMDMEFSEECVHGVLLNQNWAPDGDNGRFNPQTMDIAVSILKAMYATTATIEAFESKVQANFLTEFSNYHTQCNNNAKESENADRLTLEQVQRLKEKQKQQLQDTEELESRLTTNMKARQQQHQQESQMRKTFGTNFNKHRSESQKNFNSTVHPDFLPAMIGMHRQSMDVESSQSTSTTSGHFRSFSDGATASPFPSSVPSGHHNRSSSVDFNLHGATATTAKISNKKPPTPLKEAVAMNNVFPTSQFSFGYGATPLKEAAPMNNIFLPSQFSFGNGGMPGQENSTASPARPVKRKTSIKSNLQSQGDVVANILSSKGAPHDLFRQVQGEIKMEPAMFVTPLRKAAQIVYNGVKKARRKEVGGEMKVLLDAIYDYVQATGHGYVGASGELSTTNQVPASFLGDFFARCGIYVRIQSR